MSTVISLKTRDEDLKGSAEARALTSAPRAWTRSERGAGSLEYLGISVVVGVIILTLIAVPWLPQITAGFNNVICRVASNIPGEGISCEEQTPMTEEDFQPRCVLSRDSSTANVNGSVLFIDGENGASMVIEERSNGDYAVTIMDDKGIGASFDLAELEAGPILDVGVGAGAMGRYSEGETFVFDNEDDAIAFAEETQDYVDANGSILEAGGMFHDRPGEDAQPQETRHMVSLDGFIDGVASVGPNVGGKGKKKNNDDGDSSDSSNSGDQGSDSDGSSSAGSGQEDEAEGSVSWDWLPGVAANGNVAGEALYEVDHGEDLDDPSDDTTAITFEVEGGGNASANAFSAGDSTERSGNAAMTVEVDSNGEITGLKFQTTGVTTDTDYDSDAESTTWTTEVPVETESDRETVETWLMEGGTLPPADGVREQPPQDGSSQSEFEDLVYNSGITSSQTHSITSDGGGWGLGAKFAGIGGGVGESNSSSSEQLREAQYLQPPDSPGETRTMADAPC